MFLIWYYFPPAHRANVHSECAGVFPSGGVPDVVVGETLPTVQAAFCPYLWGFSCQGKHFYSLTLKYNGIIVILGAIKK